MASGTQDPDAEPDDPGPVDPDDASVPARDGAPSAGSAGGTERSTDPDEVWRAIVANYGDRPVLDEPGGADQPDVEPGPPARPGPADPDARLRRLFEPLDRPGPDRGPADGRGRDGGDDEADLARAPDAPFVPPTPPPLPPTTPARRMAWLGALVAPVVLLLSLVLSIDLPQVLALGLVAWFAGGFCYLVLTMSREPRDPGDDGARV